MKDNQDTIVNFFTMHHVKIFSRKIMVFKEEATVQI